MGWVWMGGWQGGGKIVQPVSTMDGFPGFDLAINNDNAIRLIRAIDPNGDYSGPEYNYDSKPKIDWGEGWRLFVDFITNRDLKK
jgi:hypothetical protein